MSQAPTILPRGIFHFSSQASFPISFVSNQKSANQINQKIDHITNQFDKFNQLQTDQLEEDQLQRDQLTQT
jgi:hypothetical protein